MAPKEKKEEVPIPKDEIPEKEIEARKCLTIYPNKFSFGGPTPKNIDCIRTLISACLPVHYRDWFYEFILSGRIPVCRCVYFNDVLVGAVCARIDPPAQLYIMAITVLEPYRRLKIGSYLMKYIENYAEDNKSIKEIYLNVHTINKSAIQFYTTSHGFKIRREIKGYYRDLKPSSCYELAKTVRE